MGKTKNGNIASKALMVGTALVTLNALAAHEAVAASGTGAMSAVILTPIVVAGTVDMHFGDITESGGGNIILDTANVQDDSAPGVTGVNNLNAPTSGVISLTAATGVAIDLAMDATSYTVNDGVASSMVVNAFNIGTNAAGAAIVTTLVASPTTFGLGATLAVGASQTPGTYTGNYTVNATYQ